MDSKGPSNKVQICGFSQIKNQVKYYQVKLDISVKSRHFSWKWHKKWIFKNAPRKLDISKIDLKSEFSKLAWKPGVFENDSNVGQNFGFKNGSKVWQKLCGHPFYLFCKILSGSLLLVLFVLELGLRMTWVSVVSSMFDLQMVNLSLSSDSWGILEWFLEDFGKIREGFLKKSSVLDLW